MNIVPESRADRLAMATGYPFDIPEQSYIYENGAHRAASPGDIEQAATDRVPVIACGSNQSPEQLARKYGHHENDVVIPVQRAILSDFDIVYSAHITAYGSIAATLQHVAGTRVSLSVLWLDAEQLAHMHSTESPGENYAYVRMERLRVALDGGRELSTAWAYNSLHGCLIDDGSMVALSAISAKDRRLPARGQRQMIDRVRRRLAGDRPFEDFVLENIGDRDLRRERIALLRRDVAVFEWPHQFEEPI